MDLNDLTEEQMKRVRECKTPEELIELAQAEDIDLSDEQLEAVSGGAWNGADCGTQKLTFTG